jgi:hypothetical protein
MEAIKRMFTPEFRNRLDATISFRALDTNTIMRVVDKFLIQLEEQLTEKKVEAHFTQALKDHLAKKGFDPLMGARPMARLIQDTVRRALADELLFGKLQHGGKVTIDLGEAEKIVLKFEEKEDNGKPKPPPDEETVPVEELKEARIVVATVPAELIVCLGEPNLSPIAGEQLLYVSNTESDVFFEINRQKYYLLLSGRWFSSPSFKEGPWTFVHPDSLPRIFAEIPEQSPKGDVLSHVPGTPQATEAYYDAQMDDARLCRMFPSPPTVVESPSGEDIAALFGLVLALIAILLTVFTGNPVWDALGSMSIGALLIVVAIGIGIEIKALLIGQSAAPESEAALRAFLLKQDGVEEIYHLITYHLGTSFMVAVKARMKAGSAQELVAAINRAEAATRAEFPEIQWLFFEPDLAD